MNIKLALIGTGYWGKNLLRVLNKLCVLTAAFDSDEDKIKEVACLPEYSHITFGVDWKTCLDSVDAVVIATPPSTHFNIAYKAMQAGKHVFIEKPMTVDVEESVKLVNYAKDNNLILMVGHIFLYTSEIEKIKAIMDAKELGDIHYIHALRLNLGKFQKASVVADLAPHDIATFNFLLNDTVDSVFAHGYNFVDVEQEEVAFVTLKYKQSKTVCNLHLSWLNPRKTRTTTIVGSKKMLIYDMSAEEKLKVYDTGVDKATDTSDYGKYLLSYRHGDIYSPNTQVWEPLRKECLHFLDCIVTNKQPLTDGINGLEVVRVLDAILRSLKTGGWEHV